MRKMPDDAKGSEGKFEHSGPLSGRWRVGGQPDTFNAVGRGGSGST